MTSYKWALVVASTLCCACDAGKAVPNGPGEVVHPREEDRLSSRAQVPVIELAYDPDAALPAWLAPLARFDEDAAVGLFDARAGSEDLVFGSLVDAQVDPSGRVLLLDRDAGAVRVLSPTLEPVAMVGRSGDGPGEFRRPSELLAVGDSGFSVLDSGASKIDRFLRAEAGFEYSESLRLTAVPYPERACYTGGSHFVRGLRLTAGGQPVSGDDLPTADVDSIRAGRQTVHKIDSDGRVLRSFSEPYQGSLPHGGRFALALSELLSEGSMACADGHLWAAYLALGEVHALDAAGNLRWIARVADYGFPGYKFRWSASGQPLEGSGSINLDLQAGTPYSIERLTHLAVLSPALLAVGVHRLSVGAAADGHPQSYTYWTYLLDPESGEFLGAFQAEHEVIGGGNGRAVLYRTQPYPQIAVVKLED